MVNMMIITILIIKRIIYSEPSGDAIFNKLIVVLIKKKCDF